MIKCVCTCSTRIFSQIYSLRIDCPTPPYKDKLLCFSTAHIVFYSLTLFGSNLDHFSHIDWIWVSGLVRFADVEVFWVQNTFHNILLSIIVHISVFQINNSKVEHLGEGDHPACSWSWAQLHMESSHPDESTSFISTIHNISSNCHLLHRCLYWLGVAGVVVFHYHWLPYELKQIIIFQLAVDNELCCSLLANQGIERD